MTTLANPLLKRSAARRFLRSYFGRIIVASILIVGISRCIWWQTFAEYRKEERIAQKIWNAGGAVGRRNILPIGPLNSFYPFRTWRRIDTVDLSKCQIPNGLPEDVNELRHLESLELGNTPVNDADLEHLRGLDQLERLVLDRTQISNSGLENLRGLTKLRGLELSRTHISDAGLEHLKGMNIRRLDLQGTAVTEAGLEHLKGLPNLTDLTFVDMHISDVGLKHLKGMTNLKRLIFYANPSSRAKLFTPSNRAKLEAALPNCTIIP